MDKFDNLPHPLTKRDPVVLTIGNFDGFHLGHQTLVNKVIETAKKEGKKAAVITFSTHPSTILRPSCPVPLLCTLEHKIKLISNTGIDELYVLEFTQDFSEQTAEDFLQYLMNVLPFSHLILGNDARLGKDRQGDQESIAALGKKLNFDVEYIPDYMIDGERISSGRIREMISKGQFDEIKRFLGRPYSIYSQVVKGTGKGAAIGFPTMNIPLDGLCLPPFGVYVTTSDNNGSVYEGIANLGTSPTVKVLQTPTIQIHLFNPPIDLYNQFVDTTLLTYLRKEMRFENIDDLKFQIARDVMNAQKYFDTASVSYNLNIQKGAVSSCNRTCTEV